MKLNNENYVFVPKGWGFELWITNTEKYCGKLLHIVKGKKLSWHYHKVKDEVMYIQKGEVLITFGESENIEEAEVIHLVAGDSFHIPRNLVHRIEAIVEAEVFEFSTQHFDEDSYRVIKGD